MPRSSHCTMAVKRNTYRQVCAFGIRSPNVQGPSEQDLAHTWSLDSQLGGGREGRYSKQAVPLPPSTRNAQSPKWGWECTPQSWALLLQPTKMTWSASYDRLHGVFPGEYLGRPGRPWARTGAGNGTENKKEEGKKRKLNSCCIIFI